MANTTEGDTIFSYVGGLASELIALTAGLVIHLFIIGVNVNYWWKGRSVTPVDHIVTSLGISRMCSQFFDNLYFYIDTFSLKDFSSQVTLYILDVIYCFFMYANLWLTTLHSIVLCLKISNLHTRLFLYLRRMILHRTGHFIVASVIYSACNSLMTSLFVIFKVTNSATYNITISNISTVCRYAHSIYSYTIGSFFPLLFYSTSSILLFTSLYHHTTRMKKSSNLSINLETYYSVMRFVSFTFIYDTVYFIAHFVIIFYRYFYCVLFGWLYTVLGFLPLLHSSYLIYKTAKLRDQMSKVLHNVTDFLFQRKNTETREHIKVAPQ